MKIDLIYNYRAIDTSYIIYGPEKIGNNIEVSTSGYIVNSISEVINKINSMVASLAPDITNCQSVSSGLYGNMYMQTWRGDLNAGSEVPDYTNILTSINTNLTNLNSKFVYNNRNLSQEIELLFRCFNNSEPDSSAAGLKVGSLISSIVLCLSGVGRNQITNNSELADRSMLRDIARKLVQSVSPSANITDVISSLNTNIHNDLTEINTTTNNKDNVLIVDGQQDFVIRKQNNDDYDS